MEGAWERRAEEERRRRALRAAAERLVMAAELRDWERFTPAPAPVVFEDAGLQLPTGTPFIRPIEDQPTVEEFAAQMRPAGQLVSDIAFGPEVESVLPGEQEAGLLERFVRTQAGEQEFRTSAERFGEGRPGAGVGWGLLGLAAGVPFFGDIAQGAAGASRAVRGAGAAGDVARVTGRDYGRLVALAGSTDEDVTRRAFNGAYSGDLSWFPEEMRNDYGLDVTENDALALIDELRAEARFPYERRGISEVYVWRAGHKWDGRYDEPVSTWDARDINFDGVDPSDALPPGDDFGEPVLYRVPVEAIEAEGREAGELLVNPDLLRPAGDVARGAIRGVQASPEVGKLLTSNARIMELSESGAISDAVDLGAIGNVPYSPFDDMIWMQGAAARLANDADGSRLIDELVGNEYFPTPLDLPEDEARAVLAIARDEMGSAPSGLLPGLRESDSGRLWTRIAERILEKEELSQEWSGGRFNYFYDNPNITDNVARAAYNRTQLYVDGVADIMAYRAYLRILDEIGPDAARAFSGAMNSNYQGIPEILRFLDESVIVVNVPESALAGIANSKRFFNQYTSGYSGGYYSPHTRVEMEFIGQGIPIGAGPSSRPIYGYLAFPDIDAATRSQRVNQIFSEDAGLRPFADETLSIFTDYTEGYGDYAFVLKPEFKNVSTFTFDDSLSSIASSSPVSGASVSDVITAGLKNLPDPKNDIREIMYMEAQVFPGEALVSDMVDYVVSKYPPSDSAIRNLRRIFGDDIRIEVMYP